MNLEREEFIRHRRLFLKRIMFLFFGLVVIIFVWLSLESYHRLLGKEEMRQTDYLLKKINPNLKMEVFDELDKTSKFSLDEVDREMKNQLLVLPQNQADLPVSTAEAKPASGSDETKGQQ